MTIRASQNPGYEFVGWAVAGGGYPLIQTELPQSGPDYIISYNTVETLSLNSFNTTPENNVYAYLGMNNLNVAIYDITFFAVFKPVKQNGVVSGVKINPGNATVHRSTPFQFTAMVSGTGSVPQTVTWSVRGGSPGTVIDQNGALTIAAGEMATSLAVDAISTANTSVMDTAWVTVPPSRDIPDTLSAVTNVTVSPSNIPNVPRDTTIQYTAIVHGNNYPPQDVTWFVTGGGEGTSISPTGMLTVGKNESGSNLTVTATSTFDKLKSGTATVTITNIPDRITGVSISPSYQSVQKGMTSKRFSATVQWSGRDYPPQTVIWSVTGGGEGTSINSLGEVTIDANEAAAALTVIAKSKVDEAIFGTATVEVRGGITGVTVSPANESMPRGTTKKLVATVQGINSPSQYVTWSVTGGGEGTVINASGSLTIGRNETAKTLTVTARSTADTSKSGTASITVTSNVPSEPQNIKVTESNRQLTLSWSAPYDIGSSAVIRYEVSSDGGSYWVPVDMNLLHKFTGLENGKSYNIAVRAVNSAGYGAEAGTTAKPADAMTEIIKTEDDLRAKLKGGEDSVNKTFVLANDIYLTRFWEPVNDFRGTFDGNGHVIHSLFIFNPETKGKITSSSKTAGLFGEINGGNVTIKNLGIHGINTDVFSTQNTAYAGGLIGIVTGDATSVNIENCYVDGREDNVNMIYAEGYSITIGSSNAYAGGIIGAVTGGHPTVHIRNSYTYINVNAIATTAIHLGKLNAYAGGLVGYNTSGKLSINNSYSAGSIRADLASTFKISISAGIGPLSVGLDVNKESAHTDGIIGMDTGLKTSNSEQAYKDNIVNTYYALSLGINEPWLARCYGTRTAENHWDFDNVWGYIERENMYSASHKHSEFPVLRVFGGEFINSQCSEHENGVSPVNMSSFNDIQSFVQPVGGVSMSMNDVENNSTKISNIYVNDDLLTPNVHYDAETLGFYESYIDTLPNGVIKIVAQYIDGTYSDELEFTIDRSETEIDSFDPTEANTIHQGIGQAAVESQPTIKAQAGIETTNSKPVPALPDFNSSLTNSYRVTTGFNEMYTDIMVYINGDAIPASIFDGKIMIIVQDLRSYGFDVTWNGENKSLSVERNNSLPLMPIHVERNSTLVDELTNYYVYLTISTFLSGELIKCYTLGDQTLIEFSLLSKYGSVSWNESTREVHLETE